MVITTTMLHTDCSTSGSDEFRTGRKPGVPKGQGVNMTQLQTNIPAIFADAPDKEKVSGKYTFIPTKRVIDDLSSFGWLPRIASGSKENAAAKHMIRFSRAGFSGSEEVRPEIVLLNSHNGLSSFNLKAGIFRLVCSNGLVVATSVFGDIRIKHINYSLPEVSRAVEQFAGGIDGVMATVDQMKRSHLSPDLKRKFAEEAVGLRWDHTRDPIAYTRLLQPRRAADDGSSVWSIMNILQEKLLKGDVMDIRGRKMRGITQVDSVVGFNQELYALAMKYANN